MSLIAKIIEIAGALMPGSLNTPLDARSRVDNLEDIYSIQNPYEGLPVYVSAEKKSYIINGLTSKKIGAVTVADAAVDTFELIPDREMIVSIALGYENTKHAKQLFVAGYGNIAGGIPVLITGYSAVTGALTLSEARPEMAVGQQVKVHTTVNDENSPYDATITAIDGNSVWFDAPLFPDESVILAIVANSGAETPLLILPVMDAERWAADDSNTTIGSYNINTGVGATVDGAVNLNNGDYAHVAGSLNQNSGDGAVISGTLNINTADHADIGGVSNKLIAPKGYGRYTFIRGNGNTAASDSITIIGTGNEVTGMGATVIGSMNKEITGRDSFAFGNRLKVLADYAKAIGHALTVRAKNAFLFGRYGELDASAENEGAIAFAGGENGNPLLAWIFRTRKAVINPLYNPSLDTAKTGTDSKGERQYIPKLAFSAQFRGRLTGTTATLTSSTNYVTLDHDQFNRWKFTPTRATIPTLENWNDNDTGELIIYNGGSYIQWPAEWVWIGKIPTLGAVISIELRKIDGIVYARDTFYAGITLSDVSALNYLTKTDAASQYAPIAHSNNSTIHITAAERTTWNAKANASHTHAISEVTSLQTALDGKAASGHNHDSTYAPISHSNNGDLHVTAAQKTAWTGKAEASHTHTIANITSLQSSLDAKAASSHTHTIANITSLQSTLDAKAVSGHNHDTAYAPIAHSNNGDLHVTAAQKTAWTGKAEASHTHTIANITSLQSSLDGKAASSHTHTIANITSLQTTLDGKAASSHNHDSDYAPKSPAWYTITYAASVALNVANGIQQKITLTGNCAITAPTLSATNQTLLLEINCGSTARTVTIGGIDILSAVTGIWQIGWAWNGTATRRYPAVEVV